VLLASHECQHKRSNAPSIDSLLADEGRIKASEFITPDCSIAHNVIHPLNGLFSGTTWVSRHQKGKTILDFNEARDDGVAGASAGPYANHMRLASDR